MRDGKRWDKGEQKIWGTAKNEGTRIWMKKPWRSGTTTNPEIARVPTRRSIAIRVNATLSRDPEPEIFVAEADRQTRDPWDLTDDEKRQVLVCFSQTPARSFAPLVRLPFRWFVVGYFFYSTECNRSGTFANLRIGRMTVTNSMKMSTSRYRRLNSCDYYFVVFTRLRTPEHRSVTLLWRNYDVNVRGSTHVRR